MPPCDDHMRGETTWTSSPTRNGRVKGVRHRRVRLHRKQRLARQPPQTSARRPQPTLHRPPRTTWPQAGRAPSCTCMLDGARLAYRECQARWRTIASSASSGWLPQRGWQLTRNSGPAADAAGLTPVNLHRTARLRPCGSRAWRPTWPAQRRAPAPQPAHQAKRRANPATRSVRQAASGRTWASSAG